MLGVDQPQPEDALAADHAVGRVGAHDVAAGAAIDGLDAAVGGVDDVTPGSGGVAVASVPAVDEVVAGPARQAIAVQAAREAVVSIAAEDRVDAVAARQPVGLVAAVELVAAKATVEVAPGVPVIRYSARLTWVSRAALEAYIENAGQTEVAS